MNEPKKTRLNQSSKFNLTNILLLDEFKFTMTIFLSAFAFTRYAMFPDRIHELCLLAILFSTLGDLCMMNHMGIPALTFKGKRLYAGVIFFSIAHIFYRQMFRNALSEPISWGIGETICLLLLIAFLVVINLCKLIKNSIFDMTTGLYTGLIFSNLAAATNCAYHLGDRYVFAFIGVVCFIISDFFLLIRETCKDTPTIRKLVWIFYPLAQILIIGNV